MICKAPNCDRPAQSKQMCDLHRSRMRRYESFDLPPKPSVEDAFWSKVRRGDASDCWLWTQSVNTSGYGCAWDGRRQLGAHRYAWRLTFGDIPSGLQVLHKCDTPRCCNPDHLFLGSNDDNVADKMAKGRFKPLYGLKNPKSKLKPADIPRIKSLRKARLSQQKIADQFGVSQVAISKVLLGKHWRSPID